MANDTNAAARDRLFIGVRPTGISYADKLRKADGDYGAVGFLSFRELTLAIEPDCPADMRRLIEQDAGAIMARRGCPFEVSTSGQMVKLGWGLPDLGVPPARGPNEGRQEDAPAPYLVAYPVRAFLDLSTAHLSKSTQDWLGGEARAHRSKRHALVGAMPTGWFVWAPPEDEGLDNWPEDLAACMGRARALKCEYILFDADAAAQEALPCYDEGTDMPRAKAERRWRVRVDATVYEPVHAFVEIEAPTSAEAERLALDKLDAAARDADWHHRQHGPCGDPERLRVIHEPEELVPEDAPAGPALEA